MLYEPAAAAAENGINPDSCLVTTGIPQLIDDTEGGFKKVLDVAILDPNDNFNTLLSRYVAPADGDYFIAGYARFTDLAGGTEMFIRLLKNGSVEIEFVVGWNPPMEGWRYGGCPLKLVTLTEGDYIEMWIESFDAVERTIPADIDNCGMVVLRVS